MKDIDVAELVRKQLNGNQSPSSEMGLTLEDVRLSVVNARAKLIESDYQLATKIYKAYILNPWEKIFEKVEVLTDDLGRRYSLFPANVFALPENKGVRLVYPRGEPECPIFPRENSSSFMLSDTPKPADDYYLAVAGDRVYFDYLPDEIEFVSMNLIPEADSDIPDAKVFDVRALCYKLYNPMQTQKDLVADSNDNVPNKQSQQPQQQQ